MRGSDALESAYSCSILGEAVEVPNMQVQEFLRVHFKSDIQVQRECPSKLLSKTEVIRRTLKSSYQVAFPLPFGAQM